MSDTMNRDLYVLEDENNPQSSKSNVIYPSTTLDQVFDQNSPAKDTLREIIAALRQEIVAGGQGNIVFPVTSVNGKQGNVVVTARQLGLEKVDNTPDMEKPLSEPQKIAVQNLINAIDTSVDLSDLYRHIANNNNPHNVTFKMLNASGFVEEIVERLIGQHDKSAVSHSIIRTSLNNLVAKVDTLSNTTNTAIDGIVREVHNHIDDENAHFDIINKKENSSNKSSNISAAKDHQHYPTNKAVSDYVDEQINYVKDSMTQIDMWIENISVVAEKYLLPPASEEMIHTVYIVINGGNNYCDIAVCKKNADGVTYSWELSSLNILTKYDNKYFLESPNGLSLDLVSIAAAIIKLPSVINAINARVDSEVSSKMQDYYTKDEIDNNGQLNSITIVPGTDNGTIRYYVNGDPNTMSENILVSGIHGLAFLEKVTEKEIAEQAVHSQHILSKAIEPRHINDKAVHANHLAASFGSVLGNVDDELGNAVGEISLEKLAQALAPFLRNYI